MSESSSQPPKIFIIPQGNPPEVAIEPVYHRLSKKSVGFASQDSTPQKTIKNRSTNTDTRPPEEKLKDISEQISGGDLEEEQLFVALIQKKGLTFLSYGEFSPEAGQVLLELGNYYNEREHYESAQKYLSKASEIKDLEDEDRFVASVERAYSSIQLFAQKQSEGENASEKAKSLSITSQKQTENQKEAEKAAQKYLQTAEQSLAPYHDYNSDNKKAIYKKNRILAFIFNSKEQYEDSSKFYELSVSSFDSLEEKSDEEYLDLYRETASSFHLSASKRDKQEEEYQEKSKQDQDNEIKYLKKLAETYRKLENEQEADKIEKSIQSIDSTNDQGQVDSEIEDAEQTPVDHQ